MKLKRNSFLRLRWLYIVMLFFGVYAKGLAQTQVVSMSINNCAMTAPNELQFDVTFTNVSAQSIQFNSSVVRFNISTAINATSDAITWGIVRDGNNTPSSDFPLSFPTTGGPTFSYTAASRLYSLSLGTGVYSNGTTCSAPNIASGATKKIGRFYIRNNTQNFVASQTVGMTWATTSSVIGYLNCAQGTSGFNTTALRTLVTPCNLTTSTCATAAVASNISNVTCNGGANGSATVTMSPVPSTASITYTVDGGSSQSATLSSGAFTVSGLTAGTHTVVVSNSGCSSVSTNVTITQPSVLMNSTTIVACDSYTWSVNGTHYTEGGTYTGTTVNGSGCTVNETLNLTINHSSTFYADADGDGYGNAAVTTQACTQPSGYVTNSSDCNDADASAHATATYYVDADGDGYDAGTASLCAATAPTGYSSTSNGSDCNDADATAHATATYYVDADHDGFGSTTTATLCAATAPTGYSTNNTDCNDSDATAHATATYYVDADHDGFGSTTTATLCAATAPTGYSTNNTDCNDSDASAHATATYYVDADGDGYDAGTATLCAATAPSGYASTTNGSDCNDSNALMHTTYSFYTDADADGYGTGHAVTLCAIDAATAPSGYSVNNTDCNDSDATVHSTTAYYVDADGDGYGSTTTVSLCATTAPTGYTTDGTDCNDNDGSIHPGATEIANGIDDNCNGSIDEGTTAPSPIVSNVTLCKGSTATALTATALPGYTLKWYTTSTTTTALASAPVPVTTATGTFSWWVSQKLGAGVESPRVQITVSVIAVPTAGPGTLVLTDPSSLTPTTAITAVGPYVGTASELTLTAALVAGATSYTWTLPS